AGTPHSAGEHEAEAAVATGHAVGRGNRRGAGLPPDRGFAARLQPDGDLRISGRQPGGPLVRLLRELLAAVQFLTRLPVPNYRFEPDMVMASAKLYPIVGALVGLGA